MTDFDVHNGKPRVHGNGFIQLDLDDGTRLHVWDDDIPRQKVNTSKHDHAFGFESRVICGSLINATYEVEEDPTGLYRVYTPRRREGTEDTKLMRTGERVNVIDIDMDRIYTGQTYSFEPLVFHDTFHVDTTATILRKTQRLDVEPRILVPWEQEPDNEFDRDGFDPEQLWPIIDKALDLARENGEYDA